MKEPLFKPLPLLPESLSSFFYFLSLLLSSFFNILFLLQHAASIETERGSGVLVCGLVQPEGQAWPHKHLFSFCPFCVHHNRASLKKRFGQINTRHMKTSLPHPHNINRYLSKVVKFANLVVHQSNQSADSLTCLASMGTQCNVLWFLLWELFISLIHIIHSTVLFNKRQLDKGQKGKWQLDWNDNWNWAKRELCLQPQLVLFLLYLLFCFLACIFVTEFTLVGCLFFFF